MIDTNLIRRLIDAATPGPLKINRFDNPSDINYQLQSEWHTPGGGLDTENEDFVVVANIRDDMCPRAKPTAELIKELYNHADELVLSAQREKEIVDLHDLCMNEFRAELGVGAEAPMPTLRAAIRNLKAVAAPEQDIDLIDLLTALDGRAADGEGPNAIFGSSVHDECRRAAAAIRHLLRELAERNEAAQDAGDRARAR